VVETSVAGSQVTACLYPEARSNICAVKLMLLFSARQPTHHSTRPARKAAQAGEFKR